MASSKGAFWTLGSAFALVVVVALSVPGQALAVPKCGGVKPTIVGTTGADTLNGTEGDDVIRGGDGNDQINAGGGNDIVCAGPGNDTSSGGEGVDRMRSGSGNDTTNGDGGDDDMRGQGGADFADGGAGVDTCLFEDHVQCEADLRLDLTGPTEATRGTPTVFTYDAAMQNAGPSTALDTRINLTLPAESEFVASASDSRCAAILPSQVRCSIGPMGRDNGITAAIGLRFPDCFDEQPNRAQNGIVATPVTLAGIAEDPRTNDHVPPNENDSVAIALAPDPFCFG